MAELLGKYDDQIESLTVVPSDGGRFEVSVDGELIFSKLKVGRHAQAGEVLRLFDERLGRRDS